MTLATCHPQDGPHAAAVFFVAEHPSDLERTLPEGKSALHLYFFSEPHTHHGRDLAENPLASATIYPQVNVWQEIRGLQLHGRAEITPPGTAWQHAWRLYRNKFPFVRALKSVVVRNTLYLFIPTWIRLVDNSQGFGHKREWVLR